MEPDELAPEARWDRIVELLALMAMHVAIALVTYNLLVNLAPVRARRAETKNNRP